jgi:hypothetical protein
VGRLALAELHAGQAGQALVDLQAVAQICRLLTAGDRFTDDARQAAQEAAQAIAAARAGTAPPSTAIAPAMAAVELLEAALPHVPWRRLAAAKAAAEKRC